MNLSRGKIYKLLNSNNKTRKRKNFNFDLLREKKENSLNIQKKKTNYIKKSFKNNTSNFKLETRTLKNYKY